ncbi:MAG: triose-phosphate isomerase [Roseomonas sp.]|nr:triose-phosphate isomerase [Roseomonas sp.]MCA3282330.1 triose-phosphate isomerase [Roseomonas sp.]MCA3299264.1 triose-phosphate isomerase [Roseomonas sp.]
MTPGVRPLIAGNWKMHGLAAEAQALARAVAAGAAGLKAEVLICPPATLIAPLAPVYAGVLALGGQDCHEATKGAHTGDISAAMLKDAGAGYVILGHSERRMAYRETSHRVRAKAEAALAAGLIPVVCVGEPEDDRLLGRAEEVVAEQMTESLPAGFGAAGGVVAYEPVWAIGTGRTPTEADIAAMHAMMRARLVASFPAEGAGLRLIYGGSVKPGNAVAILALPHVDGALVGGASLVAEDFLAIARAAV